MILPIRLYKKKDSPSSFFYGRTIITSTYVCTRRHLNPQKLILVGTRTTYRATGDATAVPGISHARTAVPGIILCRSGRDTTAVQVQLCIRAQKCEHLPGWKHCRARPRTGLELGASYCRAPRNELLDVCLRLHSTQPSLSLSGYSSAADLVCPMHTCTTLVSQVMQYVKSAVLCQTHRSTQTGDAKTTQTSVPGDKI